MLTQIDVYTEDIHVGAAKLIHAERYKNILKLNWHARTGFKRSHVHHFHPPFIHWRFESDS